MPGLPVVEIVMPASLDGQLNGQLDTDVLTAVDNGQRLAAPAAAAWKAMRLASGDDRVALIAGEGYRDLDRQIMLFEDRWVDVEPAASKGHTLWDGRQWWLPSTAVTAAYPGHSNHGWGLAVDVVLNPGVLGWLMANAAKFGWSWEAGINVDEPWHIHFFAGDALHFPGPVPTAPPVSEDELMLQIMRIAGAEALFEAPMTKLPDGSDYALYARWIADGNHIAALTARGVPVVDHALEDLRNVTLLGPVPQGDNGRRWSSTDFASVV